MIKIRNLEKKLISKNRFLKVIILLAITVAFVASLYGIIKNTTENTIIYQNGSIDQIGPVTNMVKIKQEINVREGEFNNISVQVSTYGRKNEGDLIFKLYKDAKESQIATRKINMCKLKNNEFILFDFKTITANKGEKYYFTVETTASSANNSPAIWKNPNQTDNFSLFINNKKVSGKLCYKVGYKKPYLLLKSFIFIIAITCSIIFAYFSNELITKKSQALAILFFILSTIFIYLNISVFYENGEISINNLILVFSLVLYICYFLYYNNQFNEKFSNIHITISFFSTPFILLFLVELFDNNLIYKMNIKIVFINYLCILALYLFLYVITNRINIALIIGNVISYFVGLIYYYVLLFRGSPVLPADFYAITTAGSVIKNYKFKINLLILSTLFLMILICIVCKNLKENFKTIKTKKILKITTVTSITFFVITGNSLFSKAGAVLNLYNQRVGYEANGVIVNFLINIKYLKIEKPENYSLEKVNSIISQMKPSNKTVDNDTVKSNHPNIIVIMNESFSDLSIISSFKTNEDYMPFIHNLNKNVIKGNLFVSTFGGGTSTTEWEFLTGNSMAFIPSGGVPYQQYIHIPSNSLARTLKGLHYNTIALHPNIGSAWNRDKAYPLLGFDNFITYEKFKNPELVRGSYVSDLDDYKKVIKIYEEKQKDSRVFIFNTTIQNHGGYQTDNSIFKDSVYLTNQSYSDVNEYLSLIKKSDEAFGELVKYFSSQNEPTIVLMFGDHLPSLDVSFYEKLYKKSLDSLTLKETQKQYTVPFLIWANYDIKQKYVEKISTNYLSTLLLDIANLPLTKYDVFLQSMYNRLPVINVNGYIDAEGNYYEPKELKYKDLINNYKIIQFNNMFDTKNTEKSLFTFN